MRKYQILVYVPQGDPAHYSFPVPTHYSNVLPTEGPDGELNIADNVSYSRDAWERFEVIKS